MEIPLSTGNLAQLRAFAAVAEAASFSRAAAALGITASALSQTIRALEADIGVRLLHRTTRSVSLTEAGEQLLGQSGPALASLASALDDARRRRTRPAGTVRVHSFRYPASRFIAPVLPAFHAEYPDVRLDITLSDEVADIVSGRFDIGLRIGEVVAKDMIALRLGPEITQIAVASPAYLASHGTPLHPRDLAGHSCIGWRWPGHERAYDWEFCENGKWFTVAVNGPLIASDKVFGMQAAIDGLGIAFVLREMAAASIAEGRLIPLLEAWAGPFPGYCLCYPAQRQMAPALRAFVDAVCAYARTGRAIPAPAPGRHAAPPR